MAEMNVLTARIEGIGFWASGLPSWPTARDFARGGELPASPPAKPTPQMLAPNERRRAPESVAVALEVALAACQDAGRDPAGMPAVFASTHGDLAITDYMCSTLSTDPATVSPTKFHNAVHNAAAGYWTIGAGSQHAATAISAFDASFTQGLIEALVQLADGAEAVLLVAYDTASTGPIRLLHECKGLLGAALVLSRGDHGLQLRAHLQDGELPSGVVGPIARHAQCQAAGNAMAPMLPLFDALARGAGEVILKAAPGRLLCLEVA